MATLLFKDGKPSKFEANRVNGALEAGWTVDSEEVMEEKADRADKVIKAANKEVVSDVDYSDKAIRSQAKEAGIGNYWNKTIENLKKELD